MKMVTKRILCYTLIIALFVTNLSPAITAKAVSVSDTDNVVVNVVNGEEQTAESSMEEETADMVETTEESENLSQTDDQTSASEESGTEGESIPDVSENNAASEHPVNRTSGFSPYDNYAYGELAFSGHIAYGYDDEGNEIPVIYVEDLDEIIALAESGMDLEHFFQGTLYQYFTLENLYALKESDYTLLTLAGDYLDGSEIPNWALELFSRVLGKNVAATFSNIAPLADTEYEWPETMVADPTPLSTRDLGHNGRFGDGTHGRMWRLRLKDPSGTSYDALCLTYGGGFSHTYTYTQCEPEDVVTGNGSNVSEIEQEYIWLLANYYEGKSNKGTPDYIAIQLMTWFVLNNGMNTNVIQEITAGHYDDAMELIYEYGIDDALHSLYPNYNDPTSSDRDGYYAVHGVMSTLLHWINASYRTSPMENFLSFAANMPNTDGNYIKRENMQYWKSGATKSQCVVTWILDFPPPTFNKIKIPYINAYYIEETATTDYSVDITKEAAITNEHLEGIKLSITESEASGSEINHEYVKGTKSEEKNYTDTTTDNFGSRMVEYDIVPYMDDDIKPSGGNHYTEVTTDVNGHASATFVHSHTFKEFYSVCYTASGEVITYSDWQTKWNYIFSEVASYASTVGSDLAATTTITVITRTGELELPLDTAESTLRAMYNAQKPTWTQTQADAQSKIADSVSAYNARTYTYTVKELDTFTREASEDSNDNTLDEIRLPKEGYRKDINGVTTIGTYKEVVENGGTMTVGGKNDSDDDTDSEHVVNEPWYNRIYINKTDLETNSQILYDAEFEIYEYYQFRATPTAKAQTIYPSRMLNTFKASHDLIASAVKNPKVVITSADGSTVYETIELDLDDLVEGMANPSSYKVSFTPTAAGTYKVHLQFELDNAATKDEALAEIYSNAVIEKIGQCSCDRTSKDCDTDTCPVCSRDADFCVNNQESGTPSVFSLKASTTKELTATSLVEPDDGDPYYELEGGYKVSSAKYETDDYISRVYYELTSPNGTVTTLYEDENNAHIVWMSSRTFFVYTVVEDTGIILYQRSDGAAYMGKDSVNTYIDAVVNSADKTVTLYYYSGDKLFDGSYEYTENMVVTANQISYAKRDYNVDTDIEEYTTWGQDNYEIVRITADIAKKMNWSDETIGMYTVHRLSPTDQYAGVTFSSAVDTKTGKEYGYYEYGTLYYTQANLGHFCIVEKTAPADGNRNGYLGNYADREYTKLDETSSKKNNEGDPYATDDQISTEKMVHYLHLCVDTNQYATYMLTDGYTEYDDVYYANYVEALEDGTLTLDGYDAELWKQSGKMPSIGLERFFDPSDVAVNDVLNSYWDAVMSNNLSRESGLKITKNSDKTDTFHMLEEKLDVTQNYVGSTVNTGSYNSGDSKESNLWYYGSYTNTEINYNSYAEQAKALNRRHGFNGTQFIQFESDLTYDNDAKERETRYYTDGKDASREQGYAFIDERTYGYIRFSKYDRDAERYISDELKDDYEGGDRHGDSGLDGAVYSLYVAETNSFEVHYLEGSLNGVLFWAQPLTVGGYRLIWDADNNAANGFTDTGYNSFDDYTHAALSPNSLGNLGIVGTAPDTLYLHLDYKDDTTAVEVTAKSKTFYGIRHPDGMYGGAKHNGWFAVLEEQQVFVDASEDGYGDTWTLQDITLENGAHVASAAIKDGELEFNGLYLGDYYIAEEVRDAVVVFSTNNDDIESSEIHWVSFAHGYLADTDDSGNPVKYFYSFPYVDGANKDGAYEAQQDYVQKETTRVSKQIEVKGAGFQINKVTDASDETSGSTNTSAVKLEGAGFTIYLISELTKIQDGTIVPAWSETEGHELVKNNDLVALLDDSGNLLGYQYSADYLNTHNPFAGKYEDGYDIEDVNRIVYVNGHGYYYTQDILDAYVDMLYNNEKAKWDFSGEERAIARMYEDDPSVVEEINRGYAYVENHLNAGSPCEWYGINGLSKGWVPDTNGTSLQNSNEYVLSEIFTNHYGHLRSPELPFGAYIVVETSIPKDVFTVDPIFITISDNSATANRSKAVTAKDASFVASLVLVKRDAYSGQDVKQTGTAYRIWDYQHKTYVSKYLLGENGSLSMISQKIFRTDEDGRINAVASLEIGSYRIEEVAAPDGYYNKYWDLGNADFGSEADGEKLGGIGEDADRLTDDNVTIPYLGTVDFEVTTERKYQSSGITSSNNLEYIYIGEYYFNGEILGKITILKTGEVLVGYENTDNIEFADEFVAYGDEAYNQLKSSAKERSVFESMKNYYDLGTDEVVYRTISYTLDSVEITPISYIAVDANGVRLAAVYEDEDNNGQLTTMNGGLVYRNGVFVTDEDGKASFYPNAELVTPANQFVYVEKDGSYTIYIYVPAAGKVSAHYEDLNGKTLTNQTIIKALKPYAYIDVENENGEKKRIDGPVSMFREISENDTVLVIMYELSMDVYENATLKAVNDTFIYTVAGDKIASTSYLVTRNANGDLITNDYGVITKNGDGTYTLTYQEAIYDPDINYNYVLTFGDGTTINVKLVTYGVYMTANGDIVTLLPTGGYSVTNADGTTTEYADAVISLEEKNTGNTFDFVYEERPLADATYQITAAEDILSGDGNGGYWFKQGDVVATLTTGEDGELVSFAPIYKTKANAGGGAYDYTYYYGNTNGTYTSLTGEKSYTGNEFASSGSIENYWIASRMSAFDKSIFDVPSFTDATIYPNTYYQDTDKRIFRRVYRASGSKESVITNFVDRLENEGGVSTSTNCMLTKTADGYRLTYSVVDTYKGAVLEADGDYFTLKLANGYEIPARESQTTFRIVTSYEDHWAAGDIVEKTERGYHITHNDTGLTNGGGAASAEDIGYTYETVYGNASIIDNGNGIWTLTTSDGTRIADMEGGLYITEFGGFIDKINGGYTVTQIVCEDMSSNNYRNATLSVSGGQIQIKDDKWDLIYDKADGKLKTANGNIIDLADDYNSVIVTVDGEAREYTAFDLVLEYTLSYSTKKDIVTVEKDGTLGTVSIYLPLGKYNVQEIAVPYGFLINDTVQTVELRAADQIKEVVFNTYNKSINATNKSMSIWTAAGLPWFLGGLNTIGEKLLDIAGTNFWTWGTWGDAEKPYFSDENGFLSFFNLRVKAWSNEWVVEKPDSEGIKISKRDITTLQELPGAELTVTDSSGNVIDRWTSTTEPHIIIDIKDGTYTLTEKTAPAGYIKAESVTFTVENGKCVSGTVVMYDAPDDKTVYISKRDITGKGELAGAQLVVTDMQGVAVDSWTSDGSVHEIKGLKDGTYKLTEITAPKGYTQSESITFTVKDGVVYGGTVVMYDAPDNRSVYISKQDFATKKELPGAVLELKDASGNTVEKWTSTDTVHVIENLSDGKYTLTEILAPNDYDKAESITFTVSEGKVIGGPVVMYDEYNPDDEENDRHPDEHQWNLGVGIYKTDKNTTESLAGAKFGLYTTNDIYNVDGKLLVQADTLLAVATTDESGFANFAVDIALMSRYIDKDRNDPDLIYDKLVSYTYDSLTKGPDADTYWLSAAACDTILLTKRGDFYYTTDGRELTIDEATKTVSYMVEQSIDGNTAVNTGDYYIQEITPPNGYLIDDTIYDVSFEYDDWFTMYIPVYAKHANVPTEVTLTKMDLTGLEEVEGATISVYKIKDVYAFDESGFRSHADDNLTLIDTWVSTKKEHVVKDLLLSNIEWPRIPNEEVRENIYVFREEIPAEGYVTAKDIEFKIYQISDDNGNWLDAGGNLYGYEVVINHIRADQDYLSGLILAPNENADDWIRTGQSENLWDYTKPLDGIVAAKWLLVNKNLVFFLNKELTQETLNKVIREEDFEDMVFDTVFFEGKDGLQPDFYKDLIVSKRPADSYITFTQVWESLDEHLDMVMYDDITKIKISKRDIVTGEEVKSAKLEVWLLDEKGNEVRLIDSWTTGDDGYDEDGRPLPHYIEKLTVGKTYVLKETLAPTEDGYVKSNSVVFTVEDTGEIQHIIMEDDFTKLRIRKTDIVTGEEVEGAKLELWRVDAKGKKTVKIAEWTTGDDGYDEDGKPLPHYLDHLPVGNYVLIETLAPTWDGYVTSQEIYFTLAETGILQTVEMVDDITKLDVYKVDVTRDENGNFIHVGGAVLEIYSLGTDFDPKSIVDTREIVVTKDQLVTTITTKADGPTRIDKLPVGWYIMREVSAPIPYLINEVPVLFEIIDTPEVQYIMMEDMQTNVVKKVDSKSGKMVAGAKMAIYALPDYVEGTTVTKDMLLKENLVRTFTSTKTPYAFTDAEPGFYALVELAAPSGYKHSSFIKVFYISENKNVGQIIEFKNTKIISEGPDEEIGLLKLSINGGRWWNNVRTEDSGIYGSSIKLIVKDDSAHNLRNIAVWSGILLILLATAATFITIGRKKRKEVQ